MNARQFFDTVVSMRSAQREYFSLRKSGADQITLRQALHYSLELEGQVDREIVRVQEILKKQTSSKP